MDNLTYTDGFKDDIKALVRPCQLMALQIMVDVANGTRSGEPLENLLGIGDLSDCYKIRFDHDPAFLHEGEYRFRLVYRMVPGQEPTAVSVEAVAVGKRENLAVYGRALENLGR